MLFNEKQLTAFGKFILSHPNVMEGNAGEITDTQYTNWLYSEGFDFVASYEPQQNVYVQFFEEMPPILGIIHKVHVFTENNRYDVDVTFPGGSTERLPNVGKHHIYKENNPTINEWFEKREIPKPSHK